MGLLAFDFSDIGAKLQFSTDGLFSAKSVRAGFARTAEDSRFAHYPED